MVVKLVIAWFVVQLLHGDLVCHGHGRQIEDSSNHDSSRIIGNGGSVRISRCNLRYPDLLHDQIVRRLHLSQVQAAL